MDDSLILKISVIFTIASIFFIFFFVLYLDEDLREKIFKKRKSNSYTENNLKPSEERLKIFQYYMDKITDRGSFAKNKIDIASFYFISSMIEISTLKFLKKTNAVICDVFIYCIWVMKTLNNKFLVFETNEEILGKKIDKLVNEHNFTEEDAKVAASDFDEISQEKYGQLLLSCFDKFEMCYPDIVNQFSKENLIRFATKRFLYFDRLFFDNKSEYSFDKISVVNDSLVSCAILKEIDTNVLSSLSEQTPIYLSSIEQYALVLSELNFCSQMVVQIFSNMNPHLFQREA